MTLINEAFEGIFSLDSKAWRTTFYLFFKPGFLTNEHFANRRARYISPLRLYLITSIGFFLTLSMLNLFNPNFKIDVNQNEPVETNNSEHSEPAADNVLSSNQEFSDDPKVSDTPTTLPGNTEQPTTELVQPLSNSIDEFPQITIDIPMADEEMRQQLNSKLQAKIENAVEIAKKSPKRLISKIIDTAPPVVFILLPFFALILKVVYITSKRYYAEHLILALHNHSFLFAAITLMTLSPLVLSHDIDVWFSLILTVWIGLYMLLSLKRVFRQSWTVTIIKTMLLGLVYVNLLSLGLVTVTLIGILLL
ncbi:DUF3667 domain-containing protein [Arenicella xantha]|uniref:DUF3667 domain-containing protein n=1 Tax=Arenicella xantha TaxID=644221 RepID=UPI0014729091|nr:DUF3667 domain-containing protein [Arenicella xantha]